MRCALYIRVSNGKVLREISKQYQQELLYKYIQEKGWDISKCYIYDHPETSAVGESLQEMIKDAEKKIFDIILTEGYSRISGDSEFLTKINEHFESKGIQLLPWIIQDHSKKFPFKQRQLVRWTIPIVSKLLWNQK